MTLFASILHGLGLSQSEAADFLGVRLDTVKNWSSGRRPAPHGVWTDLHRHAALQVLEARRVAGYVADHPRASTVELEASGSDKEARKLGWPSAGAHMAVLRRAWEMLPPDANIRIVPLGSAKPRRAIKRIE